MVILCGLHIQGAQGINCGRHLANHCVNVTALTQLQTKESSSVFSSEIDLFKLSRGLTVIDVAGMYLCVYTQYLQTEYCISYIQITLSNLPLTV